jgi:hypothetical protein
MDTDKIMRLIGAARMTSNFATNDLICATSWVGWTDVDEDERDPIEMLNDNLAKAENNARSALAQIEAIRALCKTNI